jgi:hypothetical protein
LPRLPFAGTAPRGARHAGGPALRAALPRVHRVAAQRRCQRERRLVLLLYFSSYGGANSIDLEVEHDTLPVHDVVLCTHVLEHVADPVAALRLLTRVVSERGLLVLSYPNPLARAQTLDWCFADASQHGH